MSWMRIALKRIFYKVKYRHKNITFGKKVILGGIDTKFEGFNVLGDNVIFVGQIGHGSYIGANSCIHAKIGKYCCIAKNVRTIIGTHPTKDFVSVHPAFFSTKKQAGFSYTTEDKFREIIYLDDEGHSVIVGNDVWIGEDVQILQGTVIGDGAIIAAGATVTKDVPPYAIVGGVPAKVIRYRFDEITIERLLELKWWDKPDHWIKKHAEYFTDVKALFNLLDSGV